MTFAEALEKFGPHFLVMATDVISDATLSRRPITVKEGEESEVEKQYRSHYDEALWLTARQDVHQKLVGKNKMPPAAAQAAVEQVSSFFGQHPYEAKLCRLALAMIDNREARRDALLQFVCAGTDEERMAICNSLKNPLIAIGQKYAPRIFRGAVDNARAMIDQMDNYVTSWCARHEANAGQRVTEEWRRTTDTLNRSPFVGRIVRRLSR